MVQGLAYGSRCALKRRAPMFGADGRLAGTSFAVARLLLMAEGPKAYRERAMEMRRRAHAAPDLRTRLTYWELAEHWEELARAVEHKKTDDAPPDNTT